MHRKLYISLELIRENIHSKDVMEALAFAIMIKRTFSSSIFYNASLRNIKRTFHIGTDRINNVVSNAIKYGFVERVDNNLKALKLKQENGLNVQYKFVHNDKTNAEHIECDVRLNDIVKWLNEQVILNHINVQNKSVNAYRKQVNPSSHKEYKIARRSGKLLNGSYVTLSLKRISKLLGVSLYKARMVVRALLSQGAISMSETITETTISINDFTKQAQQWLKDNAERGFFFADHKTNIVYMKTANTYTCQSNNVRFVSVPEF